MKKNMMLAALAAVTLSSVGFSATQIPDWLQELHTVIDSNCGGNDNGSISTYDVKKFNATAVLNSLKKADKRKGCGSDRVYSTSREDAVRRFKREIQHQAIKECLGEYVSKADYREFVALFENPQNLAVFAGNISEDSKNPEGCSYYQYLVYRKDGVRVEFVFDYTD